MFATRGPFATPPKAARVHGRCATNALTGCRASRRACCRPWTRSLAVGSCDRVRLMRRRSMPLRPNLGFPGIWFLNGCYQWGCTALACEQGGVLWLVRTLDWPFPGLGRDLEIARMRGTAGDFDNVTWPGYVGVLTASAPGRFAACINQAPMWRRTRRPWLRPYDIALNARRRGGFVLFHPTICCARCLRPARLSAKRSIAWRRRRSPGL